MSMSISLNTAAQALLAQQMAVDTTSHNISNASTVGYSRQRVSFEAMPGSYVADGQPHPGYGVGVTDISRIRDIFIEFQLRGQMSSGAQYDTQLQSLAGIESVMGEPGDAGFRAALDQFFNAWRDLSNNPESGPARIAVLEAGKTLATNANRLGSALVQQRTEANTRIAASITEVNTLASQIAKLNEQIVPLKISGTSTGDLEDKRDLALDRLAQIMNVSYFNADDGSVEISVGGHPLVARNLSFALEGVPNALNANYLDVRFTGDAVPLNVLRGEMRANLDMRDSYVPARIAELDTLVAQVVNDVNAVHAAGYGLDGVTGRNFFTGTSAATVAVNATIANAPNAVAASTTAGGVPGDAHNALALADLQNVRGLAGGTQTYDEFYASLVSGIGVTVNSTKARGEAQSLVLEQLTARREGASGVNVDEEMVNLVKYQRAFEAASRLVKVADDMLDTLINRMI